MCRYLSSAILFLLSLPVLAATGESTAADAPVETVSMVYVVIFGIVFVGLVAGFFAYMIWGGSDPKSDDKK